jgi:hypothetical protein
MPVTITSRGRFVSTSSRTAHPTMPTSVAARRCAAIAMRNQHDIDDEQMRSRG